MLMNLLPDRGTGVHYCLGQRNSILALDRGASPDRSAGPLIIDPEMGLNSEHTIAALKAWYTEEMERSE